MANFDMYEHCVGSWFASAIINGDYSSLTPEESEILDRWLDVHKIGRGHWDGFAEEDSLGFRRDDITGLRGDCYRVRRLVLRS